ncbi:MAG: hypothetical protein A2255_10065 [Candidatus Melainabacteria bacterium RIFOXYA2_FULL_32_9]|nr:MAG: hypothetical protein A2255_10065 [Candidatus Melainabacteria bacterium RIFOXYA2_FULL_32_9]
MYNNSFKNNIKNNPVFNDLVIKTESAYNLNNQDFDYEKLIEFLDSENLRHFALLNIEKVKNQEDAQKLLFCLTQNDSRVRELSSFLIKDLIIDLKYRHFFNYESSIDILVNSLKDSNPKVCKNVTLALQHLDNKLTSIKKIVKIIKTNNQTTIYWYLHALENILLLNNCDISSIIENLIQLISETSESREYQIREKTAFIVKTINQKGMYKKSSYIIDVLSKLTQKLLSDENFYVRNAISFTN